MKAVGSRFRRIQRLGGVGFDTLKDGPHGDRCFGPNDKARLLKEDSNRPKLQTKKLLQNLKTSTIFSNNHNNGQFLFSGRYVIPPESRVKQFVPALVFTRATCSRW